MHFYLFFVVDLQQVIKERKALTEQINQLSKLEHNHVNEMAIRLYHFIIIEKQTKRGRGRGGNRGHGGANRGHGSRRGHGGAGRWGQGAGNGSIREAAAENEIQHEPACNYCIIVHQHHHHYN